MPGRIKGVQRSKTGTRKNPIKRFCKKCGSVQYFSRRVRPNGYVQHDCKGCQRRRDKKKHTPTYNTWRCMIDRCTNPNAWNYKYYGGRGITVCDAWLDSYEQFTADVGERPEGLTLDRIDVEKGYAPNNCKWATWSEQQANKRRPDANTDTFAYYLAHNEEEAREKGLA